jgi:hypothetical protein
MSDPDGRIPLSPPQPGDEHDWTYLQPVVDAELAWGNVANGGFTPHGRGDGASLTFRKPLHMDRLRATFLFPDIVELYDVEPRTEVIDTRFPYQEIRIRSDIPLGWIRGDSPSGYVRDPSRITKLMLRLSRGGRKQR